jgi:tryptophan synthase alpha chain
MIESLLRQDCNNRLSKKLKVLSEKNEHALICYVLPGYPDINTTHKIVSAVVEAGADIIELGIPFSDPVADGPVIQEASYQSLNNGITPEKCLTTAKEIRAKFPEIPIVVITYYNILYKRGLKEFLKQSVEYGVDGFIIPDMSLEESDEYVREATALGLATIFLASPNTKESRLKSIASKSSGFVYIISVYGTTGMRESFENYTLDNIKNVKRILGSTIPLAVGFGINTPAQAKLMIDSGADAIIVASALIDKIKNSKVNEVKMVEEIKSFVSDMKKACKE